MVELAFVMNLKKDEFIAINEMLLSQISFYQVLKQNSYSSPRQYSKFEQDLDVFSALSLEEFENKIWKCIPKLEGNKNICEKIAKINGIYEMFYDQLATEIRKTKNERLDKETKLLNSYKQNKVQVDNLYNDVNSLKEEFQSNLKQVESIIEFFNKNDLAKISIFYNGELWDKTDDNKQVVINEDTCIHNVCKTDNREVLEEITKILKDKENEYRELLIYLLKSGPTSSKIVENLQAFYKLMDEYNKNEYVSLDEVITLKEKIENMVKIVSDLLIAYHEYIDNL